MTGLEILGAADAALGMISNLYKTYTTFRDAPAEIRAHCTELEALRQILGDVAVSPPPPSSVSEPLYALVPSNRTTQSEGSLCTGSILVAIRACESECNTAWRAASQLRSDPGTDWKTAFSKVGKSVVWILKTEEIEQSTRRLERLKQSLVLSVLFSGMRKGANRYASPDAHAAADIAEYLGSMVDARIQCLQDNLLLNLRLLESQIIGRVNSLSGTAKMQHLVNERMIQENSGLFADLVGFRGARDTNSESSDDQDLPVMLTQDRRGLPGLEIKEEFPSVRRRAMASTPESASSLFGRAMDRFRGERNRKRIHLSGPIEDVQDLNTTLTNVVQEVSSHRGRGLVISLCHKITSRRDVFSRIVTQSLDPLPFQLAIQASLMLALRSAECLVVLLETISEIQDALIYCEREYVLYQEPELKLLMSALFFEALGFFESAVHHLSGSMLSWIIGGEVFKYEAKRIMKLAKKITKEAEYFHRREVREIRNRVLEVDRKQDRIVRGLEEQQRIMESLQEEQKVLSSIADHQQVLQILQELLARFTPPSKQESSPSEQEAMVQESGGGDAGFKTVETPQSSPVPGELVV